MPKVKLIDAEALKNSFDSAYTTFGQCVYAKRIVDEQPTIEAEPIRHGRWIPTEYDSYADGFPVWDKWECSECGHEHSGEADTLTAFCPDCGAKMDAVGV